MFGYKNKNSSNSPFYLLIDKCKLFRKGAAIFKGCPNGELSDSGTKDFKVHVVVC